MKPIPISAERDHLALLMKSSSPLNAVAEIIWNGLDADADEVTVELRRNGLGAIDAVIVTDDGDGIPHDDTPFAFGKLGGSWKRNQTLTKRNKRSIHGKFGKGRFRAFSLGNSVEWKTCYEANGSGRQSYTIFGSTGSDTLFHASEPEKSSGKLGTVVAITEFPNEPRSLADDEAAARLTEEFAIYLSQYGSVRIVYEGDSLDPKKAQKRQDELPPKQIEVAPGKTVTSQITVIEWLTDAERALYLCDENGVALAKVKPGIQAPGFTFTAYLKSNFVRELDKEGFLIFGDGDIHPPLNKLLDDAKFQLRAHFAERSLQEAASLVAQWKAENVYPYSEEPKSPVEEAERKVFDVCAVNISSYLEDFSGASKASKKFTFTLVKLALQQNPESLQRIIQSVLGLPKEQQEELTNLLKRTTLSAIIEASKTVADRLDFLAALEHLAFDDVAVDVLKERTQLHRILVSETWIFGEEYNLSVDDEGLTTVLEKHLKVLGREPGKLAPVRREDGSVGIVDIMLSRRIPQPSESKIHHLVIELKAPKVPIDPAVIGQLMSYATAVDEDPRFKGLNIQWDFWAVSSEVSKSAENMAKQHGRTEGIVWASDDGRMRLWVKPWNQILAECRARLAFYQKRLNYQVNRDTGREYLQQTHSKYLPEKLLIRPPGAPVELGLLIQALMSGTLA